VSTVGSRVADALTAERKVIDAMLSAGRDAQARLQPTLNGRAGLRVDRLLRQLEQMSFTPPPPVRLVGATERAIAERVAGRHRPSRTKTNVRGHR
jgi:hypothetical protein